MGYEVSLEDIFFRCIRENFYIRLPEILSIIYFNSLFERSMIIFHNWEDVFVAHEEQFSQ